MGRKHTKKRRYTTPEERASMVVEYEAGAIQTALAAKYDLTQRAVSLILQRGGAKLRSPTEAQPPTFDVGEAERLWSVEQRTTYEIAEALGVSQSVVATHLKRRGVLKREGRGVRYKFFDREFFSEVSHVSAYWAGFIAADGCVHGENNTISFGLHPDDRDLLERLKEAARLDQPITERLNNKGKLYVWMAVTCPQWVVALEKNYNITPKKSLTLQPPTQLGWEFVWSFVRGVFDGDGHASADGSAWQLVSGSKPFLEWVVRDVLRSYHKISGTADYERADGTVGCAWTCWVMGPVLREVLPRLYAHSTPETRLARKYDRFVAGGSMAPVVEGSN